MFKSARWRSEKNKIKSVFKLQFKATQVPELRGKALMISLVPADVGKPTVRLEKAAVVDGKCFWENPIYETVKLVREKKTGMFNEKIYHFIVSTGSSKAGFLGEVSVNFSDYMEAVKPLTVSLPLGTSNSLAILHVTIQKMQGDADQRDIEESEERSFRNQAMDCSTDGNGSINFFEDAEQNGSFKDLWTETAAMCQETQDGVTFRRNSMTPKRIGNANSTEYGAYRRSNTMSMGSAPDGSMADSTNSPKENFPRYRLQEALDGSIEGLRGEISVLERQAEVSELELQSLRKQVVKENRRGQELWRKIVSLKEERDALETECEQFKSLHKNCADETEVSKQLHMEIEKLRVLLEEVRRELDHERDLNDTLRLQLHKTEYSNSELILAVRDLDEMLEEKNREISNLSSMIKSTQNAREDREDVSDLGNEAKEVDSLKQKITDLYCEIEVHRKDEEELRMQMEQHSIDYKILKQENHGICSKLEQSQIEQMKMHNENSEFKATIKEFKLQVQRLEKEIQKQAIELSESSGTINKLESQLKGLENELEKQALGFENDLDAMTRAKVEQEQRAIRAEEALRKIRWSNANAAERLQEEFRKLSLEMALKIDENEKMATKAVAEANDLSMQKKTLEERLQKANEELGLIKDQNEVKLQELSNQVDLKAKHIEKMSLELDERSTQIKNLKKHNEDSRQAFTIEIETLKGKIEKLNMEKNGFSGVTGPKEKLRDEMEEVKTPDGEQEMLQRWSKESEELERELASVRKEAEKFLEETNRLRSLKDEKAAVIGALRSEAEKLRVQYNELKHSLFAVQVEKENMKKQAYKLECGFQKKEEAMSEQESHSEVNQLTSNENKCPLKLPCDSAEEAGLAKEVTASATELEKRGSQVEHIKHIEMSTADGISKQIGVGTVRVKSEGETNSEKEVNASTSHASGDNDLTKLLYEMVLLKERNKRMEQELKEMQERYSEISLKFAEVEGERQQLVMMVRCLKNGKKN